MKKLFTLLTLVILISCNTVKYTHSGNVNSRLDFKKGTWLLNTSQIPFAINSNITAIAKEEFTGLLGNRFSEVNEKRDIILPGKIPKELDKFILKDIKNGTSVDFFINITSVIIANEVGVFGETSTLMSSSENTGEITIDIYDLNLLEKFYSHTVKGRLFVSENKDDFGLSKDANSIIITAFKRALKKIKKNHIK